MLKPYNELKKIDVLPFCEYRDAKDDRGKVIKVPYLNWAKCKDLLHENGAEVVYYEPILTDKGHSLFMSDVEFTDKNGGKNRCYEVRVKVVVDDKEWIMNYPLMNGAFVVRDDTINQLKVSNAQARAFVKCVAIHTGLGFNLWVKDDAIDDTPSDDLYSHNIFAIKKRVEQLLTFKIQNGMEQKDILAELKISEKTFQNIMSYFDTINRFEQALKKL